MVNKGEAKCGPNQERKTKTMDATIIEGIECQGVDPWPNKLSIVFGPGPSRFDPATLVAGSVVEDQNRQQYVMIDRPKWADPRSGTNTDIVILVRPLPGRNGRGTPVGTGGIPCLHRENYRVAEDSSSPTIPEWVRTAWLRTG